MGGLSDENHLNSQYDLGWLMFTGLLRNVLEIVQ